MRLRTSSRRQALTALTNGVASKPTAGATAKPTAAKPAGTTTAIGVTAARPAAAAKPTAAKPTAAAKPPAAVKTAVVKTKPGARPTMRHESDAPTSSSDDEDDWDYHARSAKRAKVEVSLPLLPYHARLHGATTRVNRPASGVCIRRPRRPSLYCMCHH